jgi:tetratricopeptide (TPR) repeat protein
MYAEAIAQGAAIFQTNPDDQEALMIVGFAYAKLGRTNDARAVIRRFNDIDKSQFASHYYLAIIYGALGEKDKAFAELAEALDDRDRACNEMKVDFFMDPLRDDPRFSELLKRLNLPE